MHTLHMHAFALIITIIHVIEAKINLSRKHMYCSNYGYGRYETVGGNSRATARPSCNRWWGVCLCQLHHFLLCAIMRRSFPFSCIAGL